MTPAEALLAAEADTVLTSSDLQEYRDLLLDWSREGENPYLLEAGAVGDAQLLAKKSFRWALAILSRRQEGTGLVSMHPAPLSSPDAVDEQVRRSALRAFAQESEGQMLRIRRYWQRQKYEAELYLERRQRALRWFLGSLPATAGAIRATRRTKK
jgi:hypothetical protein